MRGGCRWQVGNTTPWPPAMRTSGETIHSTYNDILQHRSQLLRPPLLPGNCSQLFTPSLRCLQAKGTMDTSGVLEATSEYAWEITCVVLVLAAIALVAAGFAQDAAEKKVRATTSRWLQL